MEKSVSFDRVSVLGGKGMLGTDLAAECRNRGIKHEVFDLPDCDITNERHLARVIDHAQVIVNCAAYTNVEKAETDVERAFRINGEAVGALAALAQKSGAWVLHIGTDFVFDGKSDRPYSETDAPNPLNVYGKSKLAGERLLAENHDRWCVLRVQWTYGHNGDNFVRKICRNFQTQKQMKVVDDQVGSPTATKEAAKAICDLLQTKPTGVYHFASQGYASRMEVARFIANQLKRDARIIPCKTGDFPSAAVRPLNSRFDCKKISPLVGAIKSWQESLGEFLERI
jgi:dTDP-4-dehydrorhamnose reductase